MDYKSSKDLLSEWISERNTTKYVKKIESKQTSRLQITERSILAALVNEYSLITMLDGKLRMFGGDDSQRCSIDTINKVIDGNATAFPGLLIIGDDICGGIFAINNGLVKNVNRGNVVFLPSDSVVFEDLEISHANFVHWCLMLTEDEWISGGWKTSNKYNTNLRDSDEYILAKLRVAIDFGKGMIE